MRQHRDPTRRNRNLGTAKQGHGQDNRDRIPRRWRDSVSDWNRRQPHAIVTRQVWGREMPFMVEHTRADCFHACTVDDVAALLDLLPKRHINNYKDIKGIQGIVLRQPSRKEQTLDSVWGRLGFWVDVGGVSGPVVFIEAQPLPIRLSWGTRLGPAGQREFDRLERAADRVERTRRGHEMEFSLEGVRRVQLFHTLPHEVGHWADMYERCERPAFDTDLENWQELWDGYWQRPSAEREQYANRYAESVIAELREAGSVPFARKLDIVDLCAEGLRLEDFVPDEE